MIIGEHTYEYAQIGSIYMVAIGKAAPAMAYEVQKILGNKISKALIITKDDYVANVLEWPVLRAGHPVPDERSVSAARELISFTKNVKEKDLVIMLISGGASALVTDLVAGVELNDIRQLSSVLLLAGRPLQK